MTKSLSEKCTPSVKSDEDSSSQASSRSEYDSIPPIVPEPLDSYDEDPIGVYIDIPSIQEPRAVNMRVVKRRMKRLIATGRLDLFVDWVKEEPFFTRKSKVVCKPGAFAIRGAVLNQFFTLFPGYMPPSGSRSTYVPIFREDLEEGLLPLKSERWTVARKDFYDAVRLKQPSMKQHLRGSLIHPAIGVFAGKDASVFKWNVNDPYTQALFNRRNFAPEELRWPAFYPPLSRVRLLVLDQVIDVWAKQGVSPHDDFGNVYLSVKDVLVSISSWLHTPISSTRWNKFDFSTKASAIILHSRRTGTTMEVLDDARDEAAQLAKEADWLPLPSDILADPVENHPFGDEDCKGCVQCCEDTRDEVIQQYADEYFEASGPELSDEPFGIISYDALPIDCWFRGLVNVGPYTYYIETEKLD